MGGTWSFLGWLWRSAVRCRRVCAARWGEKHEGGGGGDGPRLGCAPAAPCTLLQHLGAHADSPCFPPHASVVPHGCLLSCRLASVTPGAPPPVARHARPAHTPSAHSYVRTPRLRIRRPICHPAHTHAGGGCGRGGRHPAAGRQAAAPGAGAVALARGVCAPIMCVTRVAGHHSPDWKRPLQTFALWGIWGPSRGLFACGSVACMQSCGLLGIHRAAKGVRHARRLPHPGPRMAPTPNLMLVHHSNHTVTVQRVCACLHSASERSRAA